MSKSKLSISGIVYSTDPEFKPEFLENKTSTLLPAEQLLKVQLETKHRGGKTVTLLQGFTGGHSDLEILGKKLKSHCGTGGSVKDGIIIIQGDNRDKIVQWLLKNGYKNVRKTN